VENFPARYRDEPARWRDLLRDFGPTEIRAWAADLGVETYVGTSGRVFPRGQKAAGLLRGWVRRLRERGVEFRTGMRLLNLARQQDSWSAEFKTATADTLTLPADSIVLALGGASWPETGSDGMWPEILAAHRIEITPWQPSNCGWNVDWSSDLLAQAEGLPLKNLTVTAGEESVSGELLITRHGLEGGAIYRLGRNLRAMPNPWLTLDFKPQLTAEALHERISNLPAGEWFRAWKLSKAAIALLETQSPNDLNDSDRAIALVKNFKIVLTGPRPIAEAISSAGGVAWRELDENLMVRKMPGIFVAGEMIDWEAPTGGYLLQGCFATATRAGRGAALFRSVEKR
jgi:uncharacterized flavoprotein (TIGR03862 family)